jgi:YbgC/YbaW family acyl-CoA thioester hydrolase
MWHRSYARARPASEPVTTLPRVTEQFPVPSDAFELGRETRRLPPFRYSVLTRVGFSDTDAQAVVYYGRYLPYFDLARTEYHRHLGLIGHRAGTAPEGEFVMRASHVEYVAPARFDDLLEIFIRLDRLGETSVRFTYAAYRVAELEVMCTATQTLVFIDGDRQKTRIPDVFRNALTAFEGGG